MATTVHPQLARSRRARLLCAMALCASVVVLPQAAGAVSCSSTVFAAGSPIPRTGTPNVAQGLAYWPDRDWLIGSYYDDRPLNDSNRQTKNLLAVVARSSGRVVKYVMVNDPAGRRITGHMGGASVGSGHLWVSAAFGGNNLFAIPLARIAAASNWTFVTATKATSVAASSYNSFYAGRLYVGSFTESSAGTLYSYRVGADLSLTNRSSVSTPSQVQGLAVTANSYIYSTSFGRTNRSSVVVRRRADNSTARCFSLPSMSEGAVVAAGRVWVTFEAGSSKYDDYDVGRSGVQAWPAGAREVRFRSAPVGSVG